MMLRGFLGFARQESRILSSSSTISIDGWRLDARVEGVDVEGVEGSIGGVSISMADAPAFSAKRAFFHSAA